LIVPVKITGLVFHTNTLKKIAYIFLLSINEMSPHPLFFFSHRHQAPRGVAGKGKLEVRMEKMAMGISGGRR
jgi:hypothetical protein